MAVGEVLDKASILQAEVSALNALLAVQERVVIDQSAKREQAVHEARAAQQDWQSTFDAIEDLVVVVGRDHRILAANEAARKTLPGKQVVGMHCYELFHRMTSPRPNCPFEESLRTGKPTHAEWSEPHLPGCWFNVSTFPVLEEDGSVEQLVHIVRDVTARRSAEERFRLLFESSRDALMTGVLPSGRFTAGNPATVAMFRAKDEADFLLHEPGDLSPERQPDGRLSAEKAREMIETAMREGTHLFEWTHKRLDGEEFPANVLLTRVEQAGKPIILGTVRDITAQKRAEEALRTSQQIIEGIMNAIPVRIFWKDKNLVYLGCNAALARDVGLGDPKDVIGKDDFQMGWRDQAESYRADDRQVIQSGCSKLLIEEPLTTPEGKTTTILTSKVPLRSSTGEIIGVLGTYMDITDRKRMEDELRASEAKLSNALQMACAGQWEYDVATDMFTFNDNFYRIFRTTAEQVGGYQMRSADYARRFCHPDDASLVSQGIQAAIETTDPTYSPQIEHRILYADGTIGHIAVRFFIVKDGHGRTIRWHGVNQDITERKRREEALKAKTADLERANEEVKQFVYIVSHDFRAPLVNLKGFAGEIRSSLSAVASALESAGPHLGEEQRKAAVAALQTDVPEALHFIETAAANMDNYVNALLKLSRLGRQELHPERLRVAEIVERSLKGLAHQIGERGVTVSVGPLPEVVADRTALEQIMGNLLTNAVLYLEPGRPGRIEVGGSRGPDETTFFVRDNGRGIAPEDMPKVFAPFRRAGRQDVKGEGMGLAYVRALVRRHGGEINCESRFGVGTTFTFTLRNSTEKEGQDAHTSTNRA